MKKVAVRLSATSAPALIIAAAFMLRTCLNLEFEPHYAEFANCDAASFSQMTSIGPGMEGILR